MEMLPGKAAPAVARHGKAYHPPTLTMVKEAVRSLNEKKGTSAIAIRRYILHAYPGIDPIRLKYYLKQALVKGLETGDLVRPLHSSAQGATGRFKLAAGKAKQGKAQEEKPPGGEAVPRDEKKGVKKLKAKTPTKKGKTGKAKAEKPRAKAGDDVEEKAAPSKRPKTTSGKGPTKAPAKPKEKSSKGENLEKPRASEASRAKATAAPKKADPKGAKRASKDRPVLEDQARMPVAEKAKVATAAKGAKARVQSGTAKAVGGARQPEAKKGAAKGKGKREATGAYPESL